MNEPAPETIPYATPVQYAAPVGAWREGKILVTSRNSPIPATCVKCNQPPAEGFVWRKTLYWHNPGFYVLIICPGILIYAVVAMVVRKSSRVEARLCPQHLSRRRRTIAIAWLVAFAGVGVIVLAIVVGGNRQYRNSSLPALIAVGGFVLIFAAAIAGLLRARVLIAKKIDNNYAWMSGACNEYLETLPAITR